MVTKLHLGNLEDLTRLLRTDPKNGLTQQEAEKRLEEEGLNILEEKEKKSHLRKFLEQFADVLIIILIVTAFLSCFIPGHRYDGIFIFAVVVMNAIFGFWTEYKAEKTLETLKELSTPKSRVVRDGREKELFSSNLVPGDLIKMGPGTKIPADARLIWCEKFHVDESHLTGESIPVKKEPKNLRHQVPLAERVNMVYMGTTTTEGLAKAIVTSTGMSTELGQIAGMVAQEEEKQTPLQKNLDQLGKRIGLFAGVVAVAIFFLGIIRYPGDWVNPLLTSVSLAVAVIPEGLPVVVALTLSIGMLIMARKKSIVKRLSSVETLGSTNVICTDKTGTLTKNEMTVREVVTSSLDPYSIKGIGYEPIGEIKTRGKEVVVWEDKNLFYLLAASGLCTNASLVKKENNWMVVGDPTEGALVSAARKGGISKKWLEEIFPRFGEIVFDEERMRMSTLHIMSPKKVGKKHQELRRDMISDLGMKENDMVAFVKGAPGRVIDKCSRLYRNGKIMEMDEKERERIYHKNHELADQALRVLAIAYRIVPEEYRDAVYEDARDDKTVDSSRLKDGVEEDLVFLGLLGMMDPPRNGVKKAVAAAQRAGIRVVMITGDQANTAKAIGRELNILEAEDMVLKGEELEKMGDKEYMEVVDKVSVYARVSPAHKLRIVKALRAKGEVVGMTGDGVNDAPALTAADIGIAMGKSGTDVAKDAGEMILADDNFTTIVGAIEEGRKIFSNIKKFVKYQISTNIGAIILIVTATILGLQVPLFPIQILWINILMDGPPAVSLGLEKVASDVMDKPPRKKEEPILSLSMFVSILAIGSVMAFGTLYLYYYGLRTSLDYARTITFTVFVFFQLINVFNCRSEDKSVMQLKFTGNRMLLGSVIVLSLAQLVLIYSPIGALGFHTVPLRLMDWGLIISIALSVFVFEELRKLYTREIKKELKELRGD